MNVKRTAVIAAIVVPAAALTTFVSATTLLSAEMISHDKVPAMTTHGARLLPYTGPLPTASASAAVNAGPLEVPSVNPRPSRTNVVTGKAATP